MSDNTDNPDVDFERINILYDNSRFGYIGIAAAVIFFSFVIWNVAGSNYALIWMSAVFITYIPRLTLSFQFSKKLTAREITPQNVKPWEKYFYQASIIPFLCFSSAVFIPYGDGSLNVILFYAVMVMILLSGGILTYSTSLPALFLFMNVTMLPLIVRCFWTQDLLFVALGLTLLIGYLLLSRLMSRLHKLLLENITLKIENQYQSLTDPLTKLGNRRRLRLRIEDLIPVTRRRGEPFSIILLDIDRFKKFNDSYGHTAGDELLVKVAGILLECSRDQDLVVRYGGEEFLLVLPSTNIGDAIVLTERIRSILKERTEVTMSAGLAMHSDDQDFEQLIELADKSLYKAKESGRDKYVLAGAS